MKEFRILCAKETVATIRVTEDLCDGAVFRYEGIWDPKPEFEKLLKSPETSNALYILDEEDRRWFMRVANTPDRSPPVFFWDNVVDGKVVITLRMPKHGDPVAK